MTGTAAAEALGAARATGATALTDAVAGADRVGAAVLPVALGVVMGMVSLALVLAALRLVRGPSLPDRVVALELIGTVSVGVIAVYDIITDLPVYLDVAIVLTLIAFLATVAFARYVEMGAPAGRRSPVRVEGGRDP
jgi:multicomponent Na+:H+ antiporter subunit F